MNTTRILLSAILFWLAPSNQVSAQSDSDSSPRILSYHQASRYINHLRTLPLTVQRTFDWMYYDRKEIPVVLQDSSNFQVFQFPDTVTMVCFAWLEYSGLTIYRSNTDSILRAYSWTDRLLEHFPDDFKGKFDVSRTYYKFIEAANHWILEIHVVAMMDEGYREATFQIHTNRLVGSSSLDAVTRPLRH